MTSTNMGGTSDTGLSNDPIQPDAGALPTDATTDALGEPVDVVEVVEVQTYEPTPSGYDAGEGGAANGFGFRWWMVPAVAVPVAVGATTAVVVLRRRRQPARVATYNKLVGRSRDWMDVVRGSQATRSASRALAQGVESVRGAAKSLPDTASGWRGSAGDLLGVVATSAAAKQATGTFKGALDSVTGFWNTSAPRARQTLRERGRRAPATVGAARAGILNRFSGGGAQDAASSAKETAKARASKAASKAANRAGKLSDAAKPVAAAAATAAAVKAARAAKQTNRAAKRAGKRANNAVKRTRAFTFGMLVAATATYWRAWQQRLREKETRETAGGRMVSA